MNREYKLTLDLQFRCNNPTMSFYELDNETSDFFIRITSGGKLVEIDKAIVVLVAIKPSGSVASQFVEVENGIIYADLKSNMKDEIGKYTAQAMLVLEDERVITDTIAYEVNESNIVNALVEDAEEQEEYSLLTEMLSRLSTIEIEEQQRIINEADRILEERSRIEAEQLRVEAENNRRIVEQARELAEDARNEEEALRQANETLRQDNYNALVADINYTSIKFDEYIEDAEANEETRVANEATRQSNESIRQSNEITRISNENTRKADEATRQSNETSRENVFTNHVYVINNMIDDLNEKQDELTDAVDEKIDEIETRFSALTTQQQQDAEVIDARTDFEGNVFTSLKERIDYADKILRDSTVSTVETESAFTTVKETSNGYFEDVKLEGKTLVNLCSSLISHVVGLSTSTQCLIETSIPIDPLKDYTIVFEVYDSIGDTIGPISFGIGWSEGVVTKNTNGIKILKVPKEYIEVDGIPAFYFMSTVYNAGARANVKNVVLLEGDHTNNPPSYFEGLKSSGQDELVLYTTNAPIRLGKGGQL